MKKWFAILLVLLLVSALLADVAAAEQLYDNNLSIGITGFDDGTQNAGVHVYPNNGEEMRVLGADDYGFRSMKLLVFDASGRLVEAGENIYANTNGSNGSPQLTVKIPAGGFLVAFGADAPAELSVFYRTVMEGAMLYNATMSVIYEAYGSYDEKQLQLSYDNPKETSSGAKRFLFVGNSATYFNGTPIKLKGLALAAGVDIDVTYCTFGSASLSEFASETHVRGIALRKALAAASYDYVVLQDAGSATYEATQKALETLLPLVEENGAEAVLYMRYSDSRTPSARPTNAQKHHNTYTRLAALYGLTCAPAADAFLLCSELYPEINLYADDQSHHSCEGSYLISCVWLYTYLGINPVGNGYTANLPEETVKKLQECAALACEEGYFRQEMQPAAVIDGVKYGDLAWKRPYTPSGEIYTGDWTDTGEDGNPLGKLTDGIFAADGSDTAIGCYKGQTQSITIDLGAIKGVKRVLTDLHGNDSWGIPTPGKAVVRIKVSVDGEHYIDLGIAGRSEAIMSDSWEKCLFTLTTEELVRARYVRVTYQLAGRFCWLSEICVYGADDPGVNTKDLRGDIDGDGDLHAKDYMKLKRHILGTYKLTDEEFARADVDLNGEVEAKDYMMLKRVILGTFVFPET